MGVNMFDRIISLIGLQTFKNIQNKKVGEASQGVPNNADVVCIDVACKKCGKKHRFYKNLTGNAKVDDDYFIPDAFLDPKSYGQTSYDYLDFFALGKYEASGDNSRIYSKTGATPLVNLHRGMARIAARANGTGSDYYGGYQQLDFAQLIVYNLLVMMYMRTTNIQKVYGGRTGSVSGHTWTEASVTGTTDDCVSMTGWNQATDCIKILGVENPFGNLIKFVDGIYFSDATIYIHKFPQLFSDSSDNGKSIGFDRFTTNGYSKYFKSGIVSEEPHNDTRGYLFPSDIDATENSYTGDGYFALDAVLGSSGSWGTEGTAGIWYLNGSYYEVYGYTNLGARLSYRPV